MKGAGREGKGRLSGFAPLPKNFLATPLSPAAAAAAAIQWAEK